MALELVPRGMAVSPSCLDPDACNVASELWISFLEEVDQQLAVQRHAGWLCHEGAGNRSGLILTIQ